MKVGDLVKVIYDVPATVALIIKVEDTDQGPWIWLHNGECFRWDRLEVINASR
jgi:hypothetical protein